MKNSHDDIEKLLRSATEVPFTDEQKQNILRAAARLSEQQGPRRRRRRPHVRSLLAAFGGLAAALVLAVSVWRVGVPEITGNTARAGVESTAAHTHASSVQVAIQPGSRIGLQTAPLQVSSIQLASSKPGGPNDEVVATLYNVGHTPIAKGDVVGVLAFGSGQTLNTDILRTSDWLTFVNSPDAVVQPGQKTEWTFMPVTAPKDARGNLRETPQLVFYNNAVTSPAVANTTWQLANVTTSVRHVQTDEPAPNAQTTTLQLTIKNSGSTPVDLNHVISIVWFTPRNAGTDFLHPSVTRFLTHVKTNGIQAILQPGAQEDLTFALTGAVDRNVTVDVPHVVFADTTP